MADNELIVGEPRLGWLIDDNPETPEAAVMLRDTGSIIELQIPLQGMFREDGPYRSPCTPTILNEQSIVILLHVSCYFMIIAVMLL